TRLADPVMCSGSPPGTRGRRRARVARLPHDGKVEPGPPRLALSAKPGRSSTAGRLNRTGHGDAWTPAGCAGVIRVPVLETLGHRLTDCPGGAPGTGPLPPTDWVSTYTRAETASPRRWVCRCVSAYTTSGRPFFAKSRYCDSLTTHTPPP